MRAIELYESQFEQDIFNRILNEQQKLAKILNQFDQLANIRGFQITVASANVAINSSKLLDFYFILACNNSKIKRTYDKLVMTRTQLENKINSGL